MLEEIKNKAIIDKIPIMQDEGIEFLTNYIKNNNVKQILEIGTAVGYSSIKMALINKNINITTIERDEVRYKEAIANITKMNLNNQIKCIKGDALEIELNDKYDLIFIDAAKSQNIRFFEKYKCLLNKNGSIIVDNIYFHGVIHEDDSKLSRNVRGIKRKILEFIDYINSQTEYENKIYSKGDGIMVIKVKYEN